MHVEYGGLVYELDMKTHSAKVVKYRAVDIYEIVIPHTIKAWMKKFVVTEIEDDAFKYSDIRKVTLPKTLMRIGEYAFYASNLSYVFSENIDKVVICKSAFSNCTELKLASFKGVVEFYGDNHFLNCYNMDEFTSYNICGIIPNGAFSNCARLGKFHFPKGVEVNPRAFFNTNLKEVFLHDDVIIHGDIADVLHTNSILCCPNSRFLDLVYEGYSVSVVS